MKTRKVLKGLAVIVCLMMLSGPSVMAACYPDNNNTSCQGNSDYDCDVDADDVTAFLNHFGRSQYYNPCPPSGPAIVGKTGQTTS